MDFIYIIIIVALGIATIIFAVIGNNRKSELEKEKALIKEQNFAHKKEMESITKAHQFQIGLLNDEIQGVRKEYHLIAEKLDNQTNLSTKLSEENVALKYQFDELDEELTLVYGRIIAERNEAKRLRDMHYEELNEYKIKGEYIAFDKEKIAKAIREHENEKTSIKLMGVIIPLAFNIHHYNKTNKIVKEFIEVEDLKTNGGEPTKGKV